MGLRQNTMWGISGGNVYCAMNFVHNRHLLPIANTHFIMYSKEEKKMNYQQIGKRIKEQRKCHNISQQEMANYLNFSYQHISNVERGITGISLELLVRISNLLQVSVDYLLQDSLIQPYQYEDLSLISNVETYLKQQQTELFELQNLLSKTKQNSKKEH